MGSRKGKGLIKIGDTQRDVDRRIREQLDGVKMPISTTYKLFLAESAITDDGSVFRDHEVHRALERAGVHRILVAGPNRERTEWFECTENEVRAAIASVRSGKHLETLVHKLSFKMRPEQQIAVDVTA